MNANDMYLYQLLQKYKPRDLENYAYQIKHLKIELQTWAHTCYLGIMDSGSRAKGTAISIASDVDYLISLTSNCNEKSGGLKGIYDSLHSRLKSSYTRARKQNVSVRIDLLNNMILTDDLEVDITPARRQDSYSEDHSLWLSKENTWKKTNVKRHILDVSTSGRTEEIKLLKIWRELNQLEFSSIYLEYLLINNILINTPFGLNELAANFWHILLELSKDIGNPLFSRIIDPANSNNILSDLLTPNEKNQIIIKAKNSVLQKTWGQIIW